MFAIVVSGDVRQVGTRFWQFSCLDVQQQERKNSPSFVVITELWMGHFAGILDDEDIPRPKKVKYLGLIGFDDCFEGFIWRRPCSRRSQLCGRCAKATKLGEVESRRTSPTKA